MAFEHNIRRRRNQGLTAQEPQIAHEVQQETVGIIPTETEIVESKSIRKRALECAQNANDFQLDPEIVKNTIHVIVQSKGGTGKTYVASTLASFFQKHAEALDLFCFDLDSNTKSFSAFKSFNVEQFSEISTTEDGEIIFDPSAFNDAFNPMLESITNDAIVIMDTGAGGSFWSLVQYIQDLDYPTLVGTCEREWRFIFHVVISGSAIDESVETIRRLCDLIDSDYVEFVIWGNEYFGSIKGIHESIVKEHGDAFKRGVTLPKIIQTDLDAALRMMRDKNLSMSELMEEAFPAILKIRIRQYFYGSGKKAGVFCDLRDLDWANNS